MNASVAAGKTIRRLLRFVAGLASCSAAYVWGAAMPADARVLLPQNPCSLVSNDDVLHVLGWTVQSRERKPYDLHGGTGAMCFLAASQGQVVVIEPDPGTDFPGISVYNDPNAAGLAQKVFGLGAQVTLYNGTVYVARAHRNVAVRVVPDSHAASYAEVEGFAKVVIRRLH